MQRNKKARPQFTSSKGSTHATEYKCGCIMHPIAGRIRQCGALGARTLGGRFVKLDADIGKHTAGDVHRRYPVANILP
jgi:hypothetical protein